MPDSTSSNLPTPRDNKSLLSARGSTVINPDGGVHRRGNWDDVVQNTQSTVETEQKLTKKAETTDAATPSDIWENHSTNDDKSRSEGRVNNSASDEKESHPKIRKHKSASSETAEVPHTYTQSRTSTTVAGDASTEESALPQEDVSQQDTMQQADSLEKDEPFADGRESGDGHDRELQETLSSRLVRYGKAAVTSFVLPIVTPGKVTASMLTGKRENTVGTDIKTATPSLKRSIRFVYPAAEEVIPKDEHLLDTVSRQLGITKQEARVRLRSAVEKANKDATAHANAPGKLYTGRPTAIAKFVKHDTPTNTDSEIGVYINVKGGKALSFNPSDVLQVLGQYLS